MQTISRIARSTVVALATALLAACGVAAAGTGSTPSNMDFETGDLSGWTVASGDAWASTSVSDATTYWDGPFGQHGRFHLWGFAAGGDDATGVLRSSTFCLNADAISFLIAGGNDPDRLYVALVRASDVGHLGLAWTAGVPARRRRGQGRVGTHQPR
jgi:hypothetical protein